METREFDDFLDAAQQVGKVLAALLDGAAEEDVDLRRALRNYPIWTVAFAAGAGALGGWWLARILQPEAPAPPTLTPGDTARALIVDAGMKLRNRANDFVNAQPATRDYVEKLLPEGLNVDAVVEEAGAAARTWMDSVLEPKLKDGFDQVTANLSASKFGEFMRHARHYVELDEPDEPK